MAQWSTDKWGGRKVNPPPTVTPEPMPDIKYRATCGPKVFYFKAPDRQIAYHKAVAFFRDMLVAVEEL